MDESNNTDDYPIPKVGTIIKPSEATQLLAVLKKEHALANGATDKAQVKHHSDRVEAIKAVLISYQSQQRALQQRSTSPAAPSSPAVTLTSAAPVSRSASPPSADSASNAAVTVEKYLQVRRSLESLEYSVKVLEESKTSESSPEKTETIDLELAKLRPKLLQFKKIAAYIKNELTTQGKLGGDNSPSLTELPRRSDVPSTTTSLPIETPVPIPAGSALEGFAQLPAARSAITNYNLSKQSPYQYTSTTYSHNKTPSFGNAKQILSNRSASLNLAPNSLLNNYMNLGLRYSDALSYGRTSLSDNGGRVMTKRKLGELINAIGAEEGETKTSIDNDAEDLLMDLADEFVLSVTKFACRLSKHRKVDQVDIKDVQLHLDRTWNIRVAGSTTDDWKPVKRLEPSTNYTKQLGAVDAAKKR